MKLFTILRNLIQGIQNAKNYTDTEISAIDTRVDALEERGTIVGDTTKQGKNQNIDIPHTSTWRYMLVTAYTTLGGVTVVYQNIVFSEQRFANSVLFVGGYYYSSTDRGLCNVNINIAESGGGISLRNFLYANSDYVSTAYLRVRFFK